LKAIHFASVCSLLAAAIALGQTNDVPLRNQPVIPRTGQPSEILPAPTSRGTQMSPALARTPKQQTSQSAGFSFANAVTYDSGGFDAYAVSAADVNGDGKLDLVVINVCGADSTCSSNGSVGVLLNNANGTFGTAVTYDSNGWSPIAVAVADVNGDGKPDIVVTNQCPTNAGYALCPTTGTVSVLLGNGDGTFQAAVTYDSGGYMPYSLAIADVNGDGRPDLILANFCGTDNTCQSDAAVAVLLGNGDGTFQTAVNYDSGAFGADALAVADLRGDGKLDLVVANHCGQGCPIGVLPITGVLGILLGNGDGSFQPVTTYPTSAALTDSVAVADLNGDGKLDIAVGNNCIVTAPPECKGAESEGREQVDVFLGNGDGTFQNSKPYGTSAMSAGGIALADVNGDGIPDLEVAVVCAPFSVDCGLPTYPAGVGVLLGNGDGTFQAAQYFGAVGDAYGYGLSLAVSDVDGNGIPDLILTVSCPDVSCETTPAHSLVGVMINTSVVQGQDFSLAPSSSTATVMPGQPATYSVAVSPIGGFNQTVSLSCSGAPAQSVCSVSPTSVTLDGSTTASVTVTVTTQGNSAALAPAGAFPRNGGGLLFGMALFGSLGLLVFQSFTPPGSERRSRPAYLLGVCVLSLGLSSLLGCGGSSSNSKGTPPAAYTLSLTGTDGSGSTALTHTTQLTLVVQ
jgi:FG-GAP-like repeat